MGQYYPVTSIKVLLFVCTALRRFKFEVGTDRNAVSSALVAVTATFGESCGVPTLFSASRFALPSPPHGTSKNTFESKQWDSHPSNTSAQLKRGKSVAYRYAPCWTNKKSILFVEWIHPAVSLVLPFRLGRRLPLFSSLIVRLKVFYESTHGNTWTTDAGLLTALLVPQ